MTAAAISRSVLLFGVGQWSTITIQSGWCLFYLKSNNLHSSEHTKRPQIGGSIATAVHAKLESLRALHALHLKDLSDGIVSFLRCD